MADYRRAVRATIRQALGGVLAFAALSHVITTASLRALVGRPARWQRTDKFRQHQRGLRALRQASSETVLGLAGLAAAVVLAGLSHSGGIATALATGLALQAITYLAAPAVTIAADRSLPHTARRPRVRAWRIRAERKPPPGAAAGHGFCGQVFPYAAAPAEDAAAEDVA